MLLPHEDHGYRAQQQLSRRRNAHGAIVELHQAVVFQRFQGFELGRKVSRKTDLVLIFDMVVEDLSLAHEILNDVVLNQVLVSFGDTQVICAATV